MSAGSSTRVVHMVETGTLDLAYLEHERFALDEVNHAISGLTDRRGGFSNYLVIP